MEALLTRYRNLTVLLAVVVAQLLYLGYQVKTNRDDRLIRVWAVTAVTPMAGVVEAVRRNTIGFLEDYFILLDVREQNRKLKADNDRLRMENVYFRNQLATAENARALTLFQAQTPSRTVAARVIGNSTVVTAKAVFVDRGSTSGIEKGMAVVTPEGVVGKVTAVYPLVSQVLLITDPTFKVGVESQKAHIHGVLNCGAGKCAVEQIQNEDKVDVGEWFFTSGEDRVFPKGFPVGTAISVQPGQGMKDVKLNLSGNPGSVEQVLVVLQGVHRQIPAASPVEVATAKMLPAPPTETASPETETAKPETEADKILQKYQAIGKQENHVFGGYGSNIPDFNAKPASSTIGGTASLPAQTATPGAGKPASAATPKAAVLPDVLGARAPAAPHPVAPAPQPRAKTYTGPVLPLGAPRAARSGPAQQ
ncbi:MAG: rod shape-determining protein MreC [Acidobacteriaceae bacterium]|nr:rod shape-determining protein MreC [Acidobacteriaceae bacterium]